MPHPARHLSVSISRPPRSVYDYVTDPLNLPHWASGLSGSIQKAGDDWIAESPMGRVKIKFAETNDFGILDHVVTFATGETFYNPMRVFANDQESELLFTLFRLPGVADEDYESDARTIQGDLEKLKLILERR